MNELDINVTKWYHFEQVEKKSARHDTLPKREKDEEQKKEW